MATQTQQKSILDNPMVQELGIIYARVSSDEQRESGTSIENQVQKGLAYAAANNIHVPPEFIFREDYSGTTIDRPELNQVRDLLRTDLANHLIVYNPSRLDRSKYGVNTLVLMVEFQELGIGLHYSELNRQIDLNSHMDVFLFGNLGGWQAGKDRDDTVKRLVDGRTARARSGHVVPCGAAPFGYRKVKIDKRWYYEIDEKEADIVRLIFHWYVFGSETDKIMSLAEIANKLNEMGVPLKRGGMWKHLTVRFIIVSETYCGTWYYGKQSKEEAIPVQVPAIVSRELWQAAQERIEQNKAFSRRNRKPGHYLFASRIRCSECGYKMQGIIKRYLEYTYSYYGCPNKTQSKTDKFCECHLPLFNSHIVDTKVWDKLEEISSDKDKLLAGLHGYQTRQENEVEPIKRELIYVEQLIAEKTAEFESAYLDQKLLTSERAKAKKAVEIAQTEEILNNLEVKKSELLAQLEKKSLTDQQIDSTVRFAFQVARAMRTLRQAESSGLATPELRLKVFDLKRKLLELLDVQIVLFIKDGRKKAKITAKFCPVDDEVFTVEFSDINVTKLNRLNWVLFTEVVDLE